jgi:hypothetical protein
MTRFNEGLDNKLNQLFEGGFAAINNTKIKIMYSFISVLNFLNVKKKNYFLLYLLYVDCSFWFHLPLSI